MTCTADLQMWTLKFSFFSSHFAHNRCDRVANVLLENKSHVCPYYQLKMGRLSRWALAHLAVIFPEMLGTKLHSGKSRMRNIYQSECCDVTNDSNLVWWWWKWWLKWGNPGTYQSFPLIFASSPWFLSSLKHIFHSLMFEWCSETIVWIFLSLRSQSCVGQNCFILAINYKNCPYHPHRLLPTITLWVLTRATNMSSTPYLFFVDICPPKKDLSFGKQWKAHWKKIALWFLW